MPEVDSVAVDEVGAVGFLLELVAPGEHGGEHGVRVPPQRGDGRRVVVASDVKFDSRLL